MFFLPFFRASRLNGIEEFVIALSPIYRYFITTFVTFVNWNLAPVFAGVLIDTSTRWISIYSMRASNFFFFPLTALFRIDLTRYESIGADVSHRICLGRRRPRRFLSRLVFPFVFHGCGAAVCRLKTWRAEIQRNTQGFPFRTAFPYVRDSYVGEASVSFVPLYAVPVWLGYEIRDPFPPLNWPWISFTMPSILFRVAYGKQHLLHRFCPRRNGLNFISFPLSLPVVKTLPKFNPRSICATRGKICLFETKIRVLIIRGEGRNAGL